MQIVAHSINALPFAAKQLLDALGHRRVVVFDAPMGAGKTTGGVIWLYLRWLENLGSRKEGGVTAPTEKRLELVLNEFRRQVRTDLRTRTQADHVPHEAVTLLKARLAQVRADVLAALDR